MPEFSSTSNRMTRVAVVQDGARLHYAVPLALFQQGLLERAYCDWYSNPGSLSRALAGMMKIIKPTLGQRMLDRYCPELAGAKIISNPLLTWKVIHRRKHYASDFAYYAMESQVKAKWIRRAGFGNATALFGFIRSIDPGLCEAAQRQGLFTIADQIIAPYAVEKQEEAIQRERFPDWASTPVATKDDAGWIEREQQTWKALDQVTCASDYVREGLIRQGVAAERITINPYPVDDAHFPVMDRTAHKGPLVVGFVGAVNLRKGAPYFLQTAAQFDPAKVRFVMIGPHGLAPNALHIHRGNVELTGPIPRSQIPAWLGKFDLYYFPSTCEGSAGSVMEAMMTGLPVIVSPNSGSVARDGIDGRVLRYDDLDAARKAIQTYAENAELRLATGLAAARRAREFSLTAFAQRLADAIRRNS